MNYTEMRILDPVLQHMRTQARFTRTQALLMRMGALYRPRTGLERTRRGEGIGQLRIQRSPLHA